MAITDPFDAVEKTNRDVVTSDTWGHMAAEYNTLYTGWALFALSCFRQSSILDYHFEGLSGGPWFPDILGDFAAQLPQDQPGTVRFQGTYRALSRDLVAGRFLGLVAYTICVNGELIQYGQRRHCNYTRKANGTGRLII